MGCDRGEPKPQAEPALERTAEKDPAPKPEVAPKAKADTKPKGKAAMPPQARRNSPPEDMKILAEGAAAPTMQDLPSTEGPWSRSKTPTIVAFYRGHW